MDWVTGDDTGLQIPAHMAALREGGTEFLTAAFRNSGALTAQNSVTAITQFEECPGGSTGAKVFLGLAYATPVPGLPGALFVKFSRDFSNPMRDANRDQLGPEIRFAAISRRPGFPITVPACLFGDYHDASGTGILITERIAFGAGNIEPHHDKCLDRDLPDALAHYRAVVTANARLAGAHKSGHLGPGLEQRFPYDAAAAAASDPIRYDAPRLRNRAARIAAFAAEFPRLMPPNTVTPAFIAQLSDEMPLVLEHETAIKRFLTTAPDLIALCHWNGNIDNAWFWRDGAGLHCGLMDWGRVGQMNIALALWGTLSAAEPEMLDKHLDDLLALFLAEYAAHGGPAIPLIRLQEHFFLYVATMGMAWLLDAPPIVRAQIPGLTAGQDRFAPSFRENEAARTQLTMLINVLNLWQKRDVGKLVKTITRPTRAPN